MLFLRSCQSVFIFILLIFSTQFAEAKDLSTLQTALKLAREDMEKAKDKHEADVQAVIQQQRMIAERKKQLADDNRKLGNMQIDTKQAWEQYLVAKKKYEKAQSTLDAAWSKK